MKKALFFMIFIFATAIYGYAQEAPAAEQNDYKTLDSRHQNRRTMRGYKMLFEAGYQWGLPDKEGFLCGVYDPDKWASARRQASNSTISCFLAAASGLTRFFATERHALLYRYSASCDAIFSTAAPPRLSADAMATASARFTAHTTVLCSACASLSKTTTR